jgi:ATPase subunit of ABC transporter with duplicated ATPase domains
MTETVLEFKGLTKSFNRSTQVLKNIDLSIYRGRVVGLLGKNGAGKTTLIKCAMGLLKVTLGQVRLFGEDPWTMSGETKARLGYVPQKVDLYDWMRVRQMIAYIAAFYPKWNHALTTSLVSQWELNPEDSIGKLSEGQRQKLARRDLYKIVTSGDDGRFSLTGITPGNYKLFAWEDLEPNAYYDTEVLRQYESQGKAVVVTESGKVQIELKPIQN